MKIINVEEIDEDSWWRLNPRKHYMYAIEWSAEMGGVVRSKLDSIAYWDYEPCSDVRFASDVGYRLIDRQKAERDSDFESADSNAEYVYGIEIDGYSGC